MDHRFKKTPNLVWNLLSTDFTVLSKVMQHADFLRGLDQKLGAFLGPASCKHCNIANYANNTLVLHVDTPSWASRIRYNTPQILAFMQNECNLASLKTVRIKVMPASQRTYPSTDKRWKLNKNAAELISQYASSITDEALKHSLLKISKHYHNST